MDPSDPSIRYYIYTKNEKSRGVGWGGMRFFWVGWVGGGWIGFWFSGELTKARKFIQGKRLHVMIDTTTRILYNITHTHINTHIPFLNQQATGVPLEEFVGHLALLAQRLPSLAQPQGQQPPQPKRSSPQQQKQEQGQEQEDGGAAAAASVAVVEAAQHLR